MFELKNSQLSFQKQSQDRIESKVWKTDIIPFLEDKEQRPKILAKIKTVICDYIPGKYRSQIWPIVFENYFYKPIDVLNS